MRSLTNYSNGSNIILRNRQLTFNNLTAVVYDTRVTDNTLILVYYSEDSEAAAQSAGISSETNNGNITFTAANTPSEIIVCDIVLLNANMSNVVADASNIDYSNNASGLSSTDVQSAIDEVVEEKADKSDIASEFNTTTTYAKGDLCYHEGTLYKFNQAHEAGAWNSTEVDAVDIDGLFQHINDQEILYSTTADGVKTYAEILNGLYDYVTAGCELVISSTVYYFTGGRMFYSGTIDGSDYVYSWYLRVKQSDSQFVRIRIKDDGTLTYTNMSATVPSNGTGFIVRKMH